jgi:hypothetical protein
LNPKTFVGKIAQHDGENLELSASEGSVEGEGMKNGKIKVKVKPTSETDFLGPEESFCGSSSPSIAAAAAPAPLPRLPPPPSPKLPQPPLPPGPKI